MLTQKIGTLKGWQIALIAAGASALGGLSALMPSKERKELYTDKLEQAPWAPPSWLYAPAWTINNFFLIRAMQRILQKNIPEKRKLLLLQAGIWAIFFSFNYIYFKKKSPLLAVIWTMSDNVLAIASMLISARADKKLALNYLPLVVWTAYASTLADYQALKNPDPVFNTEALGK